MPKYNVTLAYTARVYFRNVDAKTACEAIEECGTAVDDNDTPLHLCLEKITRHPEYDSAWYVKQP